MRRRNPVPRRTGPRRARDRTRRRLVRRNPRRGRRRRRAPKSCSPATSIRQWWRTSLPTAISSTETVSTAVSPPIPMIREALVPQPDEAEAIGRRAHDHAARRAGVDHDADRLAVERAIDDRLALRRGGPAIPPPGCSVQAPDGAARRGAREGERPRRERRPHGTERNHAQHLRFAVRLPSASSRRSGSRPSSTRRAARPAGAARPCRPNGRW